MSKIRLFTVVYDEAGNFLVGLKNRHSYFHKDEIAYFDGEGVISENDARAKEILSFLDEQVALARGIASEKPGKALSKLQFCFEVLANRLVRYEINPQNDWEIDLNLKLNEISKEFRVQGTELLQFNQPDVDKERLLEKVEESLEYIQAKRDELKDLLYDIQEERRKNHRQQQIFEAGKITFPSVELEKPWSCYFERRVVNTCSGKQEYPIRDIIVSRDCHNNEKICIDLPKFDERSPEKRPFWIVKDACAMKSLISEAVDAFKDQFGGYDIFHQIVDNVDAHLHESQFRSIDADPNLYMSFQESDVLPEGWIPVPLYIKLSRASFLELHKQVRNSLALGAQYANEIQQGLYTCNEVNNSEVAKDNVFNRLVERQNFFGWNKRSFQRNERCLSFDMMGYYTPEIIKHLEELEIAVKHARRDKKDHYLHLVALKEQIDLLVKSNKTSVKELMKHYSNETLTTFNENGDDTGTDKANYALYQIINEFNYLLVSMDTGRNSVDSKISRLLEIPKLDGKYQTLKQAACKDKPKEIEGLNTCNSTYVSQIGETLYCFEDDCVSRWLYCYCIPKIQKNIMPQVNKLFKLMMLESEDDTLEADIRALSKRVLEQRSWQTFILDMRHDTTPVSPSTHHVHSKKHEHKEDVPAMSPSHTPTTKTKKSKKNAGRQKSIIKHYA